jgi:uncharacterized protein
MMKLSKYSHFFEADRRTMAYNSLTTALTELSADEFATLQSFCTEPRDDLFSLRGLGSFYDDLVWAGFLIPDDLDEIELIRGVHAALKERRRTLGLTIMPTLDCNFRCSYCFSYTRPQRMGADVQEALLRFVEPALGEAERLSVTWYGGEPTLCLDLIEVLSARLMDLCRQLAVDLAPASIVTNGYLLTAEVAERLCKSGIKEAQITLDGDRATHDQRRPLRGGDGTFVRILDNVAAVSSILDIKVRINIDRDNAGTAVGALDALAGRGLRGTAVYFGHVKPYSEACAGMASVCLSDQEFSRVDLALTRQALVRGFRSFRYPHLELGGVCGADQRLCYVVAPDGLLFKCWAQASQGSEQSVGSLFDNSSDRPPRQIQQKNLEKFLAWDPLADVACRECRVLPICMGGCPYIRLAGIGDVSCSAWRYVLLETLGLGLRLGQFRENQPQKRAMEQVLANTTPGDHEGG